MPDSRSRRPRLPELFVALLALTAAGVVTFAATAPPPAPHSTRLPALQGAAFRPDPRPLPGALGPVAVSGTINGAAQSVTCPVGDQGTVTLQITGTWVATMIFEGTVDNLTWATVRANALASDTLVTGATANGLFVLAGNFTAIRVRDTAYTSGAAVVTMRATPSSSANVPVSSVGGSGGGGSGGTLTNNNAAPGANNVGSLDALANAAAPAWTEGNQVLLSTDLSGRLRTSNTPTGTQTVSGTVTANAGTGTFTAAGNLTNNNAAPGVANFGALVALANAGVPTWTEGDQVLLSADLSGRLRTSNTPTGTQTVSGTVTANAGTGSFITQGTSAAAAAVSGNPLLMGGRDASGNSQFIGGNNSGVFAQGPAAAGAAVAGNPVLMGISDGTNAQTWKQVPNAATAATQVGIPFAGIALFQGANDYRNLGTAGSIADGGSTAIAAAIHSFDYNGASLDKHRNNTDATLLASAARTTTAQGTTTDQVSYNAHSVIVTLDVTGTTSTVSLTPEIDYKDPASGKYLALLTGTTVAAAGTFTYAVNPNFSSATGATYPYTKVAQADIGRIWRVVITHGNANSQTYSVGATVMN